MPHPDTRTLTQAAPPEFPPLTIRGVIAPAPPHSGGTYEVRIQLSRPMTIFEVQAPRLIARELQSVRDVVTVRGTTLERVAHSISVG